MKEVALNITNRSGLSLSGILCQTAPPTDKRLGLILHGSFGNKNYIYQRDLARAFPFDTYRFDFGGCGASDDRLLRLVYNDEVDDVDDVCNHLRSMGYSIHVIIGHSRGVGMGMAYYGLCQPQDVPLMVNVSGRFNLHDLLDPYVHNRHLLEQAGHFDYKMPLQNRTCVMRITPQDVDAIQIDGNPGERFSKVFTGDMLTIHGTQDVEVLPWHAEQFQWNVKNHTLVWLEGADHNFTGEGQRAQVISTILAWMNRHNRPTTKL